MLYPITAVVGRPECRLWIRFEDGVEGEVDLSSLVRKGVFKALADPYEFQKVFVDAETRTVAWPGGLDLAPDELYREIAGVTAR